MKEINYISSAMFYTYIKFVQPVKCYRNYLLIQPLELTYLKENVKGSQVQISLILLEAEAGLWREKWEYNSAFILVAKRIQCAQLFMS